MVRDVLGGPAMRLPWALIVGFVASGAALLLQNVLRDTWQIRTLPERVEEWLLLFVPLDLFEQGLGQFGPQAKVIFLTGTVVGMVVVLAAIGALALRAGWKSWWLLGLGLMLWLVAMAIVMPVTGAGFFATGLLISPVLTGAGYLIVCLGYASVLVCGHLLLSRPAVAQRPQLLAERRALLVGVIGTLVAGGIARFAGQNGGLVASTLPLAAAPTPAAFGPGSAPASVRTPPGELNPPPVQTAQPARLLRRPRRWRRCPIHPCHGTSPATRTAHSPPRGGRKVNWRPPSPATTTPMS